MRVRVWAFMAVLDEAVVVVLMGMVVVLIVVICKGCCSRGGARMVYGKIHGGSRTV